MIVLTGAMATLLLEGKICYIIPNLHIFHSKTHLGMCCQVSEVTPAVLTTPVSQRVMCQISRAARVVARH